MPNHVTNRITFEGKEERILAMLEAVKSDKYGRGSIDFNKLIPRPSELDIRFPKKKKKYFSICERIFGKKIGNSEGLRIGIF